METMQQMWSVFKRELVWQSVDSLYGRALVEVEAPRHERCVRGGEPFRRRTVVCVCFVTVLLTHE